MDAAGQNLPRVCMLLESYHPVVGGMETQARNMSGSFRAAGIPVIILTRRIGADLPRADELDGTPVYRTGPTGRSSRLRWAFAATCIPQLIRLRGRYDVILVPGFRALGIPAVLVSKLLRKKCVLKAESSGEMSGEFFTGGLERMKLKRSSALVRFGLFLRNRLLARADAFASLSREQTAEFTANGVRESKIVVIPQSVRTDVFHPVSNDERQKLRAKLGLPASAPVVIYTGRIVSYKGLPLLLEAWPKILEKHPGARLVACGAGGVDVFNCEAGVQSFVRERGLEGSVLLTGAIANVDEYLKAADLYALPTQNEAFPLALLEAMACGLAAVSTPVGGIPDILRDGENGLLVGPGSEPELRAAILRLLDDAALRKKLGSEALRTANENYARETVTARYVELFRRLASNQSPPSV